MGKAAERVKCALLVRGTFPNFPASEADLGNAFLRPLLGEISSNQKALYLFFSLKAIVLDCTFYYSDLSICCLSLRRS